VRLVLSLSLSPVHRMHHNGYRSQHTDRSKHPRDDLNNLQLMAHRQAALQLTNTATLDETPHLVDDHARRDPETGTDDKKDSVEHRMEHLARAMQPHINRRQRNSARRRESKESKSCALRVRLLVLAMQFDESSSSEAQLDDREDEHDAEEDGNVPGHFAFCLFGWALDLCGAVVFSAEVEHLDGGCG